MTGGGWTGRQLRNCIATLGCWVQVYHNIVEKQTTAKYDERLGFVSQHWNVDCAG